MKQQIKLSPATAECVALCYQSMQAAQEYARSISSDPGTHGNIKNDFVHVAAGLNAPIERIDKRIPRSTWNDFKTQVKGTDPIRLDNIKAMFIRLTPERQVMAEIMMEGILSGEIEFSSNATP